MKSHLRQFFCAVLTSALIASTVTFSFAASPQPSEETAADIEKASITLSDYNYTHSFTGRKAITAIAETYRLQNPEASEEISTTHTFSAAAGVDVDGKTVKAALKAAYEFSITKKRTISDEQDVVVKKGCKRNARAYVNNKIYYFNIWKKRILLKDKYCGKGHITRPVGVIFEIRKKQKK